MFIFSKSRGEIRIFVDGKELPSEPISGNYGHVQKVRIGVYDPTCEDAFSGGIIDNVIIFSQALEPSEMFWMRSVE